MSNAQPESPATVPTLADAGFEELLEKPPAGVVRRFFVTNRHFLGLAIGGLADFVRSRPTNKRRGFTFRLLQLLSFLLRPFAARDLAKQPFPVQLRKRLEILGPTYIKLGQVLSLREDLLPSAVTNELKNLLDRLPAVPFPRYMELLVQDLNRPVDEMFSWLDPVPTGSASIAQSHRATTVEGDSVILKVVKPGIKKTLERDAKLLGLFGRFLQLFLGRYQPRRVLREFTEYTLREVNLTREADNAETFTANFRDEPGIVFPRIYRQYSGPSVLCMEFFDGIRPDSDAVSKLTPSERDQVIDQGAGAIIRMLYRDGFFHADLHPGNLIILPGPKSGFIDLGMVGRLDESVRRTLLYYYYCLVTGDAENAARYLASVADPGPGGDVDGFRREVEEVSRRWARTANFDDFSLAQLILESVALGGQFRMYFPVELVLMVKALVTFEGVGQLLKPGFDVAAVSKKHISQVFFKQFSPLRLVKESLRGAPELLDAVVKAPLLITEGIRLLEHTSKRGAEQPFAGIRGTIFGGFCLLAAAVVVSVPSAPVIILGPEGMGAEAVPAPAAVTAIAWEKWVISGLLFLVGLFAALNKKS